MLLKITKKCQMNCTHCLEDATPDGQHMSKEVFEKVMNFMKNINPSVILITGGEPTEHPDFLNIMRRLIECFGKERLAITSNGMFLHNQSFTNEVLSLGVAVQVTNDERYYPHKINMKIKHDLLMYETNIRSLYPQGRAITNGYTAINKTAPNCFNLRSIACNNASSFKETVKLLESCLKFCSPSIDINGNIQSGESSLCSSIGTVDAQDCDLLNNLRNLKCNKCKMEDKLSSIHLKAICR